MKQLKHLYHSVSQKSAFALLMAFATATPALTPVPPPGFDSPNPPGQPSQPAQLMPVAPKQPITSLGQPVQQPQALPAAPKQPVSEPSLSQTGQPPKAVPGTPGQQAALPALPALPASITDSQFATDLEQLQKEIALLEEKQKRAKLNESIRNYSKDEANSEQGTGAAPTGADPQTTTEDNNLAIRSIYGVGRSFMAVIYYRGAELTVRPGTDIDGKWKVTSITSSTVHIRNGKAAKVLSLSAPSSMPQMPQQMAMPPQMPMPQQMAMPPQMPMPPR